MDLFKFKIIKNTPYLKKLNWMKLWYFVDYEIRCFLRQNYKKRTDFVVASFENYYYLLFCLIKV